MAPPKTVIFACVHNAGRSQMAAAFFNEFADPEKARAVSAGTQPGESVHPEVVAVMREVGIDLAGGEHPLGWVSITNGFSGDKRPGVHGKDGVDEPLRDLIPWSQSC